MNNADLRTLVESIINDRGLWTSVEEVLAKGVKRLLDENNKLSGLLADEIHENAIPIRGVDVIIEELPPDLPFGFQEEDLF